MTLSANQFHAILYAIDAEQKKLTTAEYMAPGSDRAVRARVFAQFPASAVQAFLAEERRLHNQDAATTDTRGTY